MSFSPIVAYNLCQRGLRLDAKGKQTAEGFAVLKGSVISPGENSRNISAASFVIGNSANGWVEWKAGDGRTLKELEQAEG